MSPLRSAIVLLIVITLFALASCSPVSTDSSTTPSLSSPSSTPPPLSTFFYAPPLPTPTLAPYWSVTIKPHSFNSFKYFTIDNQTDLLVYYNPRDDGRPINEYLLDLNLSSDTTDQYSFVFVPDTDFNPALENIQHVRLKELNPNHWQIKIAIGFYLHSLSTDPSYANGDYIARSLSYLLIEGLTEIGLVKDIYTIEQIIDIRDDYSGFTQHYSNMIYFAQPQLSH